MMVVWYDGQRGRWDHGMYMDVIERHPDVFQQWNEGNPPEGVESAIVIVAGRPSVTPLRRFLSTLKSGVVILTSEEDSYFDWKVAIPDRLEIWTQYYSQAFKEGIKTRLLLGPPSRLKDYKINLDLPRKYTWSFVGQVQNPFRQECVEALSQLSDGFLRVAEMFGGNGPSGMEYQEYLDIMCQSKYVICPSGSMSVDSFRLYEAIECGAIPITDMRCPREKDMEGYNWWNDVYPKHKIMLIDSWKNLSMSWFDERYYESRLKYNEWWTTYKQEFEKRLLDAAHKN